MEEILLWFAGCFFGYSQAKYTRKKSEGLIICFMCIFLYLVIKLNK